MGKHIIIIIFCFLLSFLEVRGQEIRGTVVDTSSQPIKYANVMLFSLPDSNFISGTATNEEGNFVLPLKSFQIGDSGFLKITSIGYADLYLEPNKNAGIIELNKTDVVVEGVVVKADGPVFKMEKGVIKADVKNTLLSDLGTGTEVLSKLPFVNVKDNTLSVFGRGTPVIYVNNRKVSDIEELLLLSSKEIKDVELILNPGSQYDATVKSVIKITTIRKERGLSINYVSTYLMRRRFSTTHQVKLNYRYKNWDFFGSVGYYHHKGQGNSKNDVELKGKNKQSIRYLFDNKYTNNKYNSDIGFNYSDSKKNSFGAKYKYSVKPHNISSSIGSVEYLNTPEAPLKLESNSKNLERNNQIDMYYSRTIKKTDIQFDANYLNGNDITNRIAKLENFSDVESNTYGNYEFYAGKLEIMHELAFGDIDYGTEISNTTNNHKYEILNEEISQILPPDTSKSTQFTWSAFLDYSFEISKFSFALGGRFEHLNYKYFYQNKFQSAQSKIYDNVFPYFRVSYRDENISTTLSYTDNVKRPSYSMLNSSVEFTDRYSYSGGNSVLKPEFQNKLSYMFSWEDFTVDLSYIWYKDPIIQISKLTNNDSVVLFTIENLDFYTEFAPVISYSPTFFEIWSPSFELGMYKEFITYNQKKYDLPVLTYEWDNSIQITEKISLSFDLWGASLGHGHLNKYRPNFRSDIKLIGNFFDYKLNVMLAFFDIFNTDREHWSKDMNNVYILKYSNIDTRGIYLRIYYRINPKRSKYQGQGAGFGEIMRLY